MHEETLNTELDTEQRHRRIRPDYFIPTLKTESFLQEQLTGENYSHSTILVTLCIYVFKWRSKSFGTVLRWTKD